MLQKLLRRISSPKKMRRYGAFFLGKQQFYPSEELQLLRWRLHLLLRPPFKDFHHSKLFIGNLQNSHFPFFWEETLDTPLVQVCSFSADRVPNINRKLKHLKAILQEVVSKLRRRLLISGCRYGKIKEHQIPHDSILIEPGAGDA